MREREGVYVGGTAEEFWARYAKGSDMTVEELGVLGRRPRYVSGCADYHWPHWEMGYEVDGEWGRRNEIDPPGEERSE